jgi:hypothetical protein
MDQCYKKHLREITTEEARPTVVNAAHRLLATKNDLLKAVQFVSDWYNTTSVKKMSAQTFVGKVRPIIEYMPYEPYKGPLFRTMYTDVFLKVGVETRLLTGAGPVQSWTTSEKIAKDFVAYLGNRKPIAVVKLLSSGHEVLNARYLKTVTKALLKDKDKALVATAKELNSILYSGLGDEDEVTMIMPPVSKVKVLWSADKYKG